MDDGGAKSTISRMVVRSAPKVMETRDPFFRAPRVLAAWQPGIQEGKASGLARRLKTFSRGAAMGAEKVVEVGRMRREAIQGGGRGEGSRSLKFGSLCVAATLPLSGLRPLPRPPSFTRWRQDVLLAGVARQGPRV